MIDQSKFPRENWKEFYGEIHEIIPDNSPPPRGKPVIVSLWVYADHAGDELTIQS